MAMTPKTELVVHLLRNSPQMAFNAIAKKAGVSWTYVAKINKEMGLRPVKKTTDQIGAFDGKQMALDDLRDCLSAYDNDEDRRIVLKGYAQAALDLYEEVGGKRHAIR